MSTIEGECKLWGGRLDRNGYGLTKHEGRHMKAHVAACLRAGRRIPKGWHIHHMCGVKSCVNPDHLEVISPLEHARRHAPEALPTLRHLRLQQGIGLRDLERLTGIPRALLSQAERGTLILSPEQMEALAMHFKVRFQLRMLMVVDEETWA